MNTRNNNSLSLVFHRSPLQRHFDGEKQREEYLIVEEGKLVSPSYTQGNATDGSL
jgi:hypothetical protein